jgi:acyl-CoA dehydrogenase
VPESELVIAFIFVVALIAAAWALAYRRVAAPVWTLVIGALLAVAAYAELLPRPLLIALITVFATGAVLLNPTPLRRAILSRPLLHVFRRLLPAVSQTERDALEAGTVWWDAELFSGRPDWRKLLAYPAPHLTPEEQAFLDGPVQELCAMVDDWEITRDLNDLPPRAWTFIKERGFLGMIIPRSTAASAFRRSRIPP